MIITINPLYPAYFTGAVLTAFTKWYIYIRKGNKAGRSIQECTSEWFFEKSSENYASWVATVAGVWAGGVIYVEKLPFPYLDGFFALPQHISIALFFGSIMEMAVPSFIKWVIRKIPGSGA